MRRFKELEQKEEKVKSSYTAKLKKYTEKEKAEEDHRLVAYQSSTKLQDKNYSSLKDYNSLLYLKDKTTYKSFLKFTNNLKTIKVQFFPDEYCIRAMLYEPFIMQ